ncbi:MAG: ParB/RepB/Spo0J family partition protein, partial [Nitrososphaerales archaeon]
MSQYELFEPPHRKKRTSGNSATFSEDHGTVAGIKPTPPSSLTKNINLSDIVDMPLVIRGNPQVGPTFTRNIRDHGVMNPPTVRPRTDGKYELVCGHRRVLGAREAGQESIQCIVRTDLSDLDAYVLALAENSYLPPNAMELADFLVKMKHQHSLSQRDLAHYAGLTEQELSNLLRVYRDEVLREKILAGELKLNPALELLHLKSTMSAMTIDEWRAFVDERSLRKTSDIRKLVRSRNRGASADVSGQCLSCGGTQSLRWKKVLICSGCREGK